MQHNTLISVEAIVCTTELPYAMRTNAVAASRTVTHSAQGVCRQGTCMAGGPAVAALTALALGSAALQACKAAACCGDACSGQALLF